LDNQVLDGAACGLQQQQQEEQEEEMKQLRGADSAV
jgi:hypothetical protein